MAKSWWCCKRHFSYTKEDCLPEKLKDDETLQIKPAFLNWVLGENSNPHKMLWMTSQCCKGPYTVLFQVHGREGNSLEDGCCKAWGILVEKGCPNPVAILRWENKPKAFLGYAFLLLFWGLWGCNTWSGFKSHMDVPQGALSHIYSLISSPLSTLGPREP